MSLEHQGRPTTYGRAEAVQREDARGDPEVVWVLLWVAVRCTRAPVEEHEARMVADVR